MVAAAITGWQPLSERGCKLCVPWGCGLMAARYDVAVAEAGSFRFSPYIRSAGLTENSSRAVVDQNGSSHVIKVAK